MDMLVLAAEATDGGFELSSVVMISLVVVLIAFGAAFFLVGPGRRSGAKRKGDIPLAMRPYHSDDELESSALERAMAWGVALALFSAVFVSVYWVLEPERLEARQHEFYEESLERGRALYGANCASCHGENLGGGFTASPHSEASWPVPALNDVVERYRDSEIVDVENIDDFLASTIKQGRPGTPMQAFGAGFLGPMHDLQVDDIVNYILAVQLGEDDVDFGPDAAAFDGEAGEGHAIWGANCARCHGDQLEGVVGPQLWNVYARYGWVFADDATRVAAEETLRATIMEGRFVPAAGIMPPFEHVLTDEALDALIEYLFEQQREGGPRFGQLGGDPEARSND